MWRRCARPDVWGIDKPNTGSLSRIERKPLEKQRGTDAGKSCIILTIGLLAATAARAEGDAAAGKIVFNKCSICHSGDAGVNRIGPSLHDIVGRHSASVANFNYSPAMKATDWTWTPEQLDKYVTDPKATVPGNHMIFPGLKDANDRANLIAYLETLK